MIKLKLSLLSKCIGKQQLVWSCKSIRGWFDNKCPLSNPPRSHPFSICLLNYIRASSESADIGGNETFEFGDSVDGFFICLKNVRYYFTAESGVLNSSAIVSSGGIA